MGGLVQVESYRNYGRAIKMMQNTIKTEDKATDDKVMASILLLCTLKDISGEESGHPNEHAPGLFYLIEKRGPEQIATSRGAELLFLALIRLVGPILTLNSHKQPSLTPRSKSTPSSTKTQPTATQAT